MEIATVISSHPLCGMLLTVLAYYLGTLAWRASGGAALMHPVLLATGLVALVLALAGIGYPNYRAQVDTLNEALSMVIVMLAVPLVRQWPLIRDSGPALAACVIAGSTIAIAGAIALPVALEESDQLVATLLPKSTTAAVAVEISEGIGGVASLTAVIVIATGVAGAVFGPWALDIVGVRDDRARGLAIGVASHAIGTARAFQISEVAGAFSSLGMILNALATIALVPLVLMLLAN